MSESLYVSISERAQQSQIEIGRDMLRTLAERINPTRFSRIALVIDKGAQTVGSLVQAALALPPDLCLQIEGGETCKSLAHVERLWHFFCQQHLDRRSLVIAVGGGAISDLVGFCAATYMRGTGYAVIPTTLLSQVDASIGGKNGFNFAGVKNLIGTIQQPVAVVIDVDSLRELPAADLRSGFAEIVKHGAIADSSYFSHVTSRRYDGWHKEELVDIIRRSCEIKAQIVQSDETEIGIRKTLNFGHTIGHAIEALTLDSDSPLSHGEAVSIGMHAAAFLSYRLGRCDESTFLNLTRGLEAVGLPLYLPYQVATSHVLKLISLDKKASLGTARWTLLSTIGVALYDQEAPAQLVEEAIELIQPHSSSPIKSACL